MVTKKVSLVLQAIMEVKERIRQKADELFRQYGIRSITMDEIANQLGVSKKTIYQAYADKDELVDAVITGILQHSEKICTKDRSIALNAIHEIFLVMKMLPEIFEGMNPVILYDLERNHPQAFQKFKQHKYSFLFQIIKENILRGKKEELYREELNVDVAAKVRVETMMLPFNQEIFPKSKFSLADLQQQMIELFLFGIANLKGHKLILKYQQDRIKA